MSIARVGDWMQTATGRQFWPLDPRPWEVDIRDIAASLSKQCRFAGHCRIFYSVAEHCVHVSNVVPSEDALWGLLHDAAEAYLVDVPRPVKHAPEFRFYREAEARVTVAICQHFYLHATEPESVRLADRAMLATEKRDVMGPGAGQWRDMPAPLAIRIPAWPPATAEAMFLERFEALTKDD